MTRDDLRGLPCQLVGLFLIAYAIVSVPPLVTAVKMLPATTQIQFQVASLRVSQPFADAGRALFVQALLQVVICAGAGLFFVVLGAVRGRTAGQPTYPDDTDEEQP